MKDNNKLIQELSLYLGCYFLSSAYGFIYTFSLFAEEIGGNDLDLGMILLLAGVVTLSSVWYAGSLAVKIHPAILCALSAGSCAIGFITIYIVTSPGILMYSAGIWLGLGWSYYYACSSMIITYFVKDAQRFKYLNRLAGIIVMGTGTSPLLCEYLLPLLDRFNQLYLIPIILDLFSSLLFLLFYFSLKESRRNGISTNKISVHELVKNVSIIWKTEVRYSIIMVFISACVFSSMMNFQIIYAKKHQLDYGLFYGSYMPAVIFSRLFISNSLKTNKPLTPTPFLLLLMLIGLVLMLAFKQNNWLYIFESILIGIGYGLVYPLIQTFTINMTELHLRQQALALFIFSYFMGVYLFSAISSAIIQFAGVHYWLSMLVLIMIINIAIACYKAFPLMMARIRF